MEPKLTLRIANSDLLPVQGRYAELLNAPDMDGVLTAWRGDTAIALLVLLSGNERVEGAAACAQPFENGENQIPLEAVSCTFLAETKAFVGNGKKDNGSRESFPDVLYGSGPVSMEPGSVQGIFVSITIPVDTAPGVYRGTVSVTAQGLETPLEKQLTLEVLDMVQPAPEEYRFDIELWQYPYRVAQYYGLEPFSQAHLEALRLICRGIGRWRARHHGKHCGGAMEWADLWRLSLYGQMDAPGG